MKNRTLVVEWPGNLIEKLKHAIETGISVNLHRFDKDLNEQERAHSEGKSL